MILKILLSAYIIVATYFAYPTVVEIYQADTLDSSGIPLVLESETVDKQSEFATDMCQTILYGNELGYKITFGEASRTMYQQRHNVAIGVSKTYNSNHLKRRGMDIQIYDNNGKYQNGGYAYKELADYFTMLHDGNVWGGSWRTFKDTPHYERRY